MAKLMLALCGGAFLVITFYLRVLHPDNHAGATAALAVAAALFILSMRKPKPTTRVTLGSVQGLRVGDTVMAHGRYHRITRIDGRTVTWRPL